MKERIDIHISDVITSDLRFYLFTYLRIFKSLVLIWKYFIKASPLKDTHKNSKMPADKARGFKTDILWTDEKNWSCLDQSNQLHVDKKKL